MKVKIIKITLLMISIISLLGGKVYATDENETLESQQEALDISSFISEAEKYTEDAFGDLDFGDIFSSAITGQIDNSTILNKVLGLFGTELRSSLTVLRKHYGSYSNT